MPENEEPPVDPAAMSEDASSRDPSAAEPGPIEEHDAATDVSAEILPTPDVVQARPGVPKAAIIGVITALVVAAGALAVVSLTGAKPPADIATVVPADVLGFVGISAQPEGAQRDALRSLMARLPAEKRTEVLGSFDKAMGSLLGEEDNFQRDVAPWLGPQLGFSALAVGESAVVVGTIGVTDDEAARAYFDANRTDATRTFEIVDHVAYIGETSEQLAAFRTRAADNALAANPSYLKELAAAGGDGLAVLWLNGEEIGKQSELLSGAFGDLAVPGLDATSGAAIFVLRAEQNGLAFVGHQTGGPTSTTRPGRPALMEGAPSAMLGALSFFDLQGSFAQLESGAAASPFGGYEKFLDVLGLDLKKDVLAWLGGEITVIATPLLEFAVIADVTDEAAYDRTLDRLATTLAPVLELTIQREGSGMTASKDGLVVVVRRAGKKVAIGIGSSVAPTQTLAKGLLTPGENQLGDSAAYKAVIGAPSDQTVFQAYVNLAVLGPFLGQGGTLAALEPFDAAALRVTLTDGGTELRLMLTLR